MEKCSMLFAFAGIAFAGAAIAQTSRAPMYPTYPTYPSYEAPKAPSYGVPASTSTDHEVSGYVRSNGTYVAPSHATNPNATKVDNYSTKGNVNPYNGKAGTKNPFE